MIVKEYENARNRNDDLSDAHGIDYLERTETIRSITKDGVTTWQRFTLEELFFSELGCSLGETIENLQAYQARLIDGYILSEYSDHDQATLLYVAGWVDIPEHSAKAFIVEHEKQQEIRAIRKAKKANLAKAEAERRLAEAQAALARLG